MKSYWKQKVLKKRVIKSIYTLGIQVKHLSYYLTVKLKSLLRLEATQGKALTALPLAIQELWNQRLAWKDWLYGIMYSSKLSTESNADCTETIILPKHNKSFEGLEGSERKEFFLYLVCGDIMPPPPRPSPILLVSWYPLPWELGPCHSFLGPVSRLWRSTTCLSSL